MQVSALRPLVRLSTVPRQITRAVWTVEMKEQPTLKPFTDIPGPTSLPIIGTLHHFIPGGELYKLDFIKINQKLYNSYGPIVRLGALIGRENTVILYDAPSVEQIHRGENEFPIRTSIESLVYFKKVYKQHGVPNKATGLLFDQGQLWKECRSIANPILLQPKTIKLYTEALDEVTMEMIKRIKHQRDEKNQIKHLANNLNLWSLESMGTIALGCRMNCFDPNIQEDSPVFQLMNVIRSTQSYIYVLDYKPNLWKLYATPTFKKAMKTFEHLEILTKYFIDKAIIEMEKNPKPDNQKGVLEKLLNINKDFAYIMASDMLMAGIDTTSNASLGVLYLLAKNTEKQNKLREELRTNPGNKDYLRACIKEGSRMMPVTSANSRVTSKEYNILGFRIPKGCRVSFAHQSMSLMEEYFVRPDEYLPERWIVDKDDPLCYKNGHLFAYNPFGYGVRSCIGRRIAELEIETFIRRAIENFEIEWFGPPPKQRKTLVNCIEEPLNFIFKDANM